MTTLEARGISGDPCIDEEEIRRRERQKAERRRRQAEKRGPNGELLETADTSNERRK